jgi:tRNA(Ile)-lysidine synthase
VAGGGRASGHGPFGPYALLQALVSLPPACAPRSGASCLVALSGGADSTALAAALAKISPRLASGTGAVHVHHGLKESDRFADHCRELCERIGLGLRVVFVQPTADSGRGPEAELRHCRYAALEKLLSPGDLLLLAHHREDQAETLLLHLLRSSGVDGLAGMPVWRPLGAGHLARPLLPWSRTSLEAWLREERLGWVEDPSNQDLGPDRNYLRHQVLPLMRSRWPASDRALARAAELLRESSELLGEWARQQIAEAVRPADVLRRGRLSTPGGAGLRAVLRTWVRDAGLAPVPAARLEEFCRQLETARADSATTLTWGNHRLRVYRDRLWLDREIAEPPPFDTGWEDGEPLYLGPVTGTLSLEPRPRSSLPATWRVRSRRGGERFASSADQEPLRLKGLLQGAGLPPWLRDAVPLLCAGNEVLAIGDWRLAPSLKRWLEHHGSQLRWRPGDPHLASWRDSR